MFTARSGSYFTMTLALTTAVVAVVGEARRQLIAGGGRKSQLCRHIFISASVFPSFHDGSDPHREKNELNEEGSHTSRNLRYETSHHPNRVF